MSAMKKKKKGNLATAFLVALILLSIAAIAFVILFDREDTVSVKKTPAVGKKKADSPQRAASEKPLPPAPAVSERESGGLAGLPEGKPTEKEVVIAKAVPPKISIRQAAIIIDDIGYDMKPVRELLSIDADITFAILPHIAHSREAARLLNQARRETLLHLPMEPVSYPKDKPGSGALFTDMINEEIIFQLEKNLDSVPYVSGVNNHMGSKFMSEEEKLTPVFEQLKKRNLFFIDSRTSQSSKTAEVAKKVHLDFASRRIFLDNDRDYNKIYRILIDAADLPQGGAPLIMIGHPYPETIRALRDANKIFQQKGLVIVPVSQLVKKKTPAGAS